MYEQADDLEWLQQLLNRSLSGASEHLRSIISPGRAIAYLRIAPTWMVGFSSQQAT